MDIENLIIEAFNIRPQTLNLYDTGSKCFKHPVSENLLKEMIAHVHVYVKLGCNMPAHLVSYQKDLFSFFLMNSRTFLCFLSSSQSGIANNVLSFYFVL